MKNNEIVLKIISIIDRIKPFIISDGGNIEFVKYVDNIVYIKLDGACKDCMFIDTTLKDGIEEIMISEISEIKEVRNIDE